MANRVPFDLTLETPLTNHTFRMGWQCPVCGRGNAVWLATCPCYKEQKSYIGTTDGVINDYTKSPVTGAVYNPYKPTFTDTKATKG